MHYRTSRHKLVSRLALSHFTSQISFPPRTIALHVTNLFPTSHYRTSRHKFVSHLALSHFTSQISFPLRTIALHVTNQFPTSHYRTSRHKLVSHVALSHFTSQIIFPPRTIALHVTNQNHILLQWLLRTELWSYSTFMAKKNPFSLFSSTCKKWRDCIL